MSTPYANLVLICRYSKFIQFVCFQMTWRRTVSIVFNIATGKRHVLQPSLESNLVSVTVHSGFYGVHTKVNQFPLISRCITAASV